MNAYALQNLIDSIYTNYPDVCDPWEIVAILEALGYTDNRIEREFGCPNALVLGQFIHGQRNSFPFADPVERSQKNSRGFIEEIEIFITQFSQSFIYTIPFIILLVLNYLPIDAKLDLLPPELNSLFAFVTMASLITSSGFVQAISRRGLFYMGLNDRIQANRICAPILAIGVVTTILLGSIGTIFCFYQAIAADKYIIVASLYYLTLSIIWMLFAIVGLQYKFASPTILIGIACVFFICRLFFKLSALESQVIITSIAFISLSSLAISNYLKHRAVRPKFGRPISLPSSSVLVYLLLPYFLYGIAYFGFIFADRLVANIAKARHLQIVAGNSIEYQNSMDLALLNLLLIVPLVEYFSYKLIMYWYDAAKHMTIAEVDSLPWRVQKKYWVLLGRILMYFALLMSGTIVLLSILQRGYLENLLTLVACLGYLAFAIGLFNTVILLSLNRLRDVLTILAIATSIDFVLGYLLGSLFGVYLAVIGLVIGAVLFATASTKKILAAIDRAEYCYFYSGY